MDPLIAIPLRGLHTYFHPMGLHKILRAPFLKLCLCLKVFWILGTIRKLFAVGTGSKLGPGGSAKRSVLWHLETSSRLALEPLRTMTVLLEQAFHGPLRTAVHLDT